MRALMPSVVVLALAGCAPDLRTDHPFDGETTIGPLVTATDVEGGGRRLVIDATNKLSQVFVDLDEAREMKPDEAFSTNGWDLAFKRYDVYVNSGASGPSGTAEVALLVGADWATYSQEPATGFQQDTPGRVFNSPEDQAWYFYDLGVHRLIVRGDRFYVIKTTAGAYVKLRMLSYYDANGTPAMMSLEYAPIAAP
jgi:hypothetical protein